LWRLNTVPESARHHGWNYCAREPAVIRIFKHDVPRTGLILLLSAKGGR
jgi:hypothetical protein